MSFVWYGGEGSSWWERRAAGRIHSHQPPSPIDDGILRRDESVLQYILRRSDRNFSSQTGHSCSCAVERVEDDQRTHHFPQPKNIVSLLDGIGNCYIQRAHATYVVCRYIHSVLTISCGYFIILFIILAQNKIRALPLVNILFQTEKKCSFQPPLVSSFIKKYYVNRIKILCLLSTA